MSKKYLHKTWQKRLKYKNTIKKFEEYIKCNYFYEKQFVDRKYNYHVFDIVIKENNVKII